MSVTNSILNDIKKMIGPSEDYDYFDRDLIIHINSALSILCQAGLPGPDGNAFRITGENETWDDFLGNKKGLELVKDFIYTKVRILFDPPTQSYVLDKFKDEANELVWRVNVEVDPGVPED